MTAPDKIRVTVDGEPVTREVTLAQVRAYLTRKGWTDQGTFDKDDEGLNLGGRRNLWQRGEDEGAHVFLWLDHDQAERMGAAIARVASVEQRHPAEVLREIAVPSEPAGSLDVHLEPDEMKF